MILGVAVVMAVYIWLGSRLLIRILQSTSPDASLTLPITESKVKKKKSVRFEDSTDPSSGDESDTSTKSSNPCSTCCRRKPILKRNRMEKVK